MPASDGLDVEAIRARERATTPGPWFWNSYSAVLAAPFIAAWESHEGFPDGERPGVGSAEDFAWRRQRDAAYEATPAVCHVPPHYGDTATGRHAADAQFIAEARQDIPALLDENARLTAENAALREALSPLNVSVYQQQGDGER